MRTSQKIFSEGLSYRVEGGFRKKSFVSSCLVCVFLIRWWIKFFYSFLHLGWLGWGFGDGGLFVLL